MDATTERIGSQLSLLLLPCPNFNRWTLLNYCNMHDLLHTLHESIPYNVYTWCAPFPKTATSIFRRLPFERRRWEGLCRNGAGPLGEQAGFTRPGGFRRWFPTSFSGSSSDNSSLDQPNDGWFYTRWPTWIEPRIFETKQLPTFVRPRVFASSGSWKHYGPEIRSEIVGARLQDLTAGFSNLFDPFRAQVRNPIST